MAGKDISSFFITWTIIGFFAIALISFTVLFPTFQGRDDIFGNDTRLTIIKNTLITNLPGDLDTVNANLNQTAYFDNEASFRGDKSLISQAKSAYEIATATPKILYIYLSYIFGDIGAIITIVIGSLLGFIGIYYVLKLAMGVFT